MSSKKTAIRLSLSLIAALVLAVPAFAQESAWEEYVRRNPAAVDDDSIDPLMRRLLHALQPDQVAALAEGADPDTMVLASGESLAEFLRDSVGGGPGLVYVPVAQCRLFATNFQTAPVTGSMAADEIRDFVARGSGTAHTDQGGFVDCGIPTEAVVVVLHFRLVADAVVDGRGSLKVWAADAPEPNGHVMEYEPVVDPPLQARRRFSAMALTELCPTGTCLGGEFKVKTAVLGAGLRGDVAGYFRPIEVADVPGAGDADTLDGLDSTDFALAVHTHDGGDITSGTVGEPLIDSLIARDDEVVDIVKDNDGTGSGIDTDLLDGRDSLDLMLQVGNCLTVSASCPAVAADALAARCWQTIQAAIDAADPSCVSNCLPAATATNRYVVKVGPGIYNGRVTMLPFVDIEGSGQKVTIIRHTANTVIGADDAELRQLTAEAIGPGGGYHALLVLGTSPMVKHVTLRTSGATDGNVGLGGSAGSAPILDHVTAIAQAGPGTNDNAIAVGAGWTVTIRNSILQGADSATALFGTGTAKIINTQLIGPASGTAAQYACLGAYDGTVTELDTNCQ